MKKLIFLVLFLPSLTQAGLTKLGIIYSSNTGRVRAIVKPDDDVQFSKVSLKNCEHLVYVAVDIGVDLPRIQNAVNQATGLKPQGDRYAIVDKNGNVIQVIHADPGCGDSVSPESKLIASDVAGVGWTYDSSKGTFTGPTPPQYTQAESDALAKYHGRDKNTQFTSDEKITLANLGIDVP